MHTDQWLKDHFFEPEKLCKLANPDVKDEVHFYQYLKQFGMYHPSKSNLSVFQSLLENKVWIQVENIYKTYRHKWNGLDVPIYIFPINSANHVFMNQLKGKSGISFPDKIFLFLGKDLKKKEMEAIFIHEYHHVNRMNSLKKEPENYTLLDSVIFEGFAEIAVRHYCGKDYTAFWTTHYAKENIHKLIKHTYAPQFHITRNELTHDILLFGGRKTIPPHFGYAVGYEICKEYLKKNPTTIQDTFSIPSEEILQKSGIISSNE